MLRELRLIADLLDDVNYELVIDELPLTQDLLDILNKGVGRFLLGQLSEVVAH